MQVTQRNLTLGLFGLIEVLAILASIYLFFWGRTFGVLVSMVGVVPLCAVLMAMYWRGWEPARFLFLFFIMALLGFVTDPFQPVDLIVAIIPAMALVLANVPWLIGSSLLAYGLIAFRGDLQSPYLHPISVLTMIGIVSMLVMARLMTDRALHEARANAQRADAERQQVEQQAQALRLANEQQQQQLGQQQRLLTLVSTLETPALHLKQGVLLAPIVGHLDEQRVQLLTARLLEVAHRERARLIVLDVEGVAALDAPVASSLLSTARALQLLGCQVIFSGITAETALTLTSQGLGTDAISAVRSLEDALEAAASMHI